MIRLGLALKEAKAFDLYSLSVAFLSLCALCPSFKNGLAARYLLKLNSVAQ